MSASSTKLSEASPPASDANKCPPASDANRDGKFDDESESGEESGNYIFGGIITLVVLLALVALAYWYYPTAAGSADTPDSNKTPPTPEPKGGGPKTANEAKKPPPPPGGGGGSAHPPSDDELKRPQSPSDDTGTSPTKTETPGPGPAPGSGSEISEGAKPKGNSQPEKVPQSKKKPKPKGAAEEHVTTTTNQKKKSDKDDHATKSDSGVTPDSEIQKPKSADEKPAVHEPAPVDPLAKVDEPPKEFLETDIPPQKPDSLEPQGPHEGSGPKESVPPVESQSSDIAPIETPGLHPDAEPTPPIPPSLHASGPDLPPGGARGTQPGPPISEDTTKPTNSLVSGPKSPVGEPPKPPVTVNGREGGKTTDDGKGKPAPPALPAHPEPTADNSEGRSLKTLRVAAGLLFLVLFSIWVCGIVAAVCILSAAEPDILDGSGDEQELPNSFLNSAQTLICLASLVLLVLLIISVCVCKFRALTRNKQNLDTAELLKHYILVPISVLVVISGLPILYLSISVFRSVPHPEESSSGHEASISGLTDAQWRTVIEEVYGALDSANPASEDSLYRAYLLANLDAALLEAGPDGRLTLQDLIPGRDTVPDKRLVAVPSGGGPLSLLGATELRISRDDIKVDILTANSAGRLNIESLPSLLEGPVPDSYDMVGAAVDVSPGFLVAASASFDAILERLGYTQEEREGVVRDYIEVANGTLPPRPGLSMYDITEAEQIQYYCLRHHEEIFDILIEQRAEFDSEPALKAGILREIPRRVNDGERFFPQSQQMRDFYSSFLNAHVGSDDVDATDYVLFPADNCQSSAGERTLSWGGGEIEGCRGLLEISEEMDISITEEQRALHENALARLNELKAAGETSMAISDLLPDLPTSERRAFLDRVLRELASSGNMPYGPTFGFSGNMPVGTTSWSLTHPQVDQNESRRTCYFEWAVICSMFEADGDEVAAKDHLENMPEGGYRVSAGI